LQVRGARRAGRGNALQATALLLSIACAGKAPVPRSAPYPDFVRYPDAEAAAVKDVHAYRGKPLCQRCHSRDGGLLPEDPVALCASCHAFTHGNHPVRVVQAVPPRDLPLWKGEVACHTCHDPHDVKRNRSGLRFAFDELCVRCHTRQHHAPPAGGRAP
jgi:predicted CXXCH cytochrome family protein